MSTWRRDVYHLRLRSEFYENLIKWGIFEAHASSEYWLQNYLGYKNVNEMVNNFTEEDCAALRRFNGPHGYALFKVASIQRKQALVK